MVSRLWLSRLLAGANFLHRLELAQAAACATIKPAAHIVEDGDDIHRAELRNARFIAEFSFGAEAGAAIGKGVPVYFAAVHVKIDCAIIAHFRSEEHTSELQSLMRNSSAVFCLTKKKEQNYECVHEEHNRTKH